LKEYDRICEIICKENDWPFVRSAAISDSKYSAGKNVLEQIANSKKRIRESNEEDETSVKKIKETEIKPATLGSKMSQFGLNTLKRKAETPFKVETMGAKMAKFLHH
jgi:hypothetical protein